MNDKDREFYHFLIEETARLRFLQTQYMGALAKIRIAAEGAMRDLEAIKFSDHENSCPLHNAKVEVRAIQNQLWRITDETVK